VSQTQTRGERNNNPGNIDRTATAWQGQSADQPDSRFVKFDAPEWGIRALARTLLTYQSKHWLATVRAIVNRWAPPGENNTGAYVKAVADEMGVDAEAVLRLEESPALLVKLVRAIIRHENGRVIYADATIEEGVRRAI
jgi:hypothetical protein